MAQFDEGRLSDLNNPKKMRDHDTLQKAMWSQGYELSDKRRDDKYGSHSRMSLRHRKTGEELKNDRGQDFGGHSVGKDTDTTALNTMTKAVKQHMARTGKVDRREDAVKQRKAEAEENKRRKAKQRDPFTRMKQEEVLGELMGLFLID